MKAADATAGSKEINTGKAITGFIVQVWKNGNLQNAKVTASNTMLKVETNSPTYTLSAGDVLNYIVF